MRLKEVLVGGLWADITGRTERTWRVGDAENRLVRGGLAADARAARDLLDSLVGQRINCAEELYEFGLSKNDEQGTYTASLHPYQDLARLI